MAELIVSVRDAAEARIALAGGASLLDVKEPSRGSLGRADDGAIVAVLDAAGGAPVSAAMGELRDATRYGAVPFPGRLTFVKWGLADSRDNWREAIGASGSLVEATSACRVVLAAYADHRRASAPSPAEVAHFAVQAGYHAMLLDTWGKDGTTLVDWMSPHQVRDLAAACRAAGVRVALAGGLGRRQIELLADARPDWFAVRGAACEHGAREGRLDEGRVRALADLLAKGT